MIKYDSFNPYIDGIFYRVTHNIGNVEVEHFKERIRHFQLYIEKTHQSLARILELFSDSFKDFLFHGNVLCLCRGGDCHPGGDQQDPSSGYDGRMVFNALCDVVFFGLILMVLGIVGEYLGKIILILNNTPQYIVRETINAARD